MPKRSARPNVPLQHDLIISGPKVRNMDLFCFASRTFENICLGVGAKRWAVATVSDAQMRMRRTKAEKYMLPGSRGLLYCNPTHSFTVPFITESKADLINVIQDLWPERWELPF